MKILINAYYAENNNMITKRLLYDYQNRVKVKIMLFFTYEQPNQFIYSTYKIILSLVSNICEYAMQIKGRFFQKI